MKIKEIMTTDVEVISPKDNLHTAAQKMRDRNIGFLPVYDGDQLVGVLSDRDIIVRAITKSPDLKKATIQELVSSPAIYCYEDQNVYEAAKLMNDNQIRRLVILSRDNKELAGVVSLGDLALNAEDNKMSGEVLQGISEP